MKKLYSVFILLGCFIFSNKSNAQVLPPLQPEQDACGALLVCGNTFYTPYSYSGIGQVNEYSQWMVNNCFSESGSVWFKFKVLVAGNIVFTIKPVDSTNDYDFSVFDVTNDTCSSVPQITNIRCNGNTVLPIGSVPGGIIGLNYTSTLIYVPAGTYGNPFNQFIAANAGDEFLLLVDNFSASTAGAAGFTLDFSGSTAVFDQGPTPEFVSETHGCGNNEIVVKLNKPIQCASIASNGSDFSLLPSGTISAASGLNCSANAGYTTEVTLQFGSPLPGGSYTLLAQNGSDNNTLLDICSNAMLVGEDLNFSLQPIQNPEVVFLDTPACLEAMIVLDHKVKCNTIAFDGSDFSVSGPDNGITVTQASAYCDALGLTDTIILSFNRSIQIAGNYTLNFGVGSDNSAVTDSCDLAIVKPFVWYVSDRGYIAAGASPKILCEPGYTNLTGNTTKPLTDFRWSPGNQVDDSTVQNTFSFINATQLFQVEAKDEFGCYRRDTVTVVLSERHPELISDMDTLLCLGESIDLFASGGVSYLWAPPQDLTCTTCPTTTASPKVTTVYTLEVTDGYGCKDTLTKTIVVFPLPVVDAGPDKFIDYGGETHLIGSSPSAYSYTWYPQIGLTNPISADPYASPLNSTLYTLSVLDTNRCVGYDSVLVTVNKRKPYLIPTGFSPNADGKNDIFKVIGVSFNKIAVFKVFNRWGDEVFSAVDNMGWDGKVKGTPAEIGVYNYLIVVMMPDGSMEKNTGTVTLLR